MILRTRAALLSPAVLAVVAGPALGQAEPFEGYTLYNPINSDVARLIDLDGSVVHSWDCPTSPALQPYLLPDGTLLRPGRAPSPAFGAGGAGGLIQLIGWDGAVLWEYVHADDDHLQHHDVEPMPNGNALFISWERKSRLEASEAGRVFPDDDMWSTEIIEVQPDGGGGATVVWEWHLWDHLVQDADPGGANYGVVADHPELFDINLGAAHDWMHCNAVDYNADLDQIVFSSNAHSEIFIIDHSTTTAEAAGHTGGAGDRGGDFLYRWGNPQNYDRGDETDRHLFRVHSVAWIDEGLPGAGNLILFNNGNRPGVQNDYSSAEEIVPPLNPGGTYDVVPGAAYGPAGPTWIYADPCCFFSAALSGAVRMPNGNTLICEGTSGYLFEVTAAGDLVWDHYDGSGVMRAFRYPPAYLEPCPADLDADGAVGVTDFLVLLAAWGTDGPGAEIAEPFDIADVGDFLGLLGAWGDC